MLKAPNGVTTVQVDGHDYAPDEDGNVSPMNPDHATALRSLGFRDPNAPDPADRTTGAMIAGSAALAAASAGAEVVLIQVWDRYPFITKSLSVDGGVPEPEQTAEQLLDAIEAHIAAVMDRYAAFDPDGDGFPGGRGKVVETDDDTLYGSSVLPAVIEVAGCKVQLGGIVAAAHTFSGLSVADWNALPVDVREQKLADTIGAVEDKNDEVFALIPAVSILERPAPAQEPAQDGKEQQSGADGKVEGEEAPQDPAERPDFDTMGQPELLGFLKPRGVTWRGNPSKAVAAQMAHDYWDAKYGARA